MASSNKESNPERDALSPGEQDAFKQRASELGKRLEEVRARKVLPAVDARARGAAMGQAFKIVAELVIGVVVGGGMGWALDRVLGTTPWLLVVFLVLGFCAGMSNVIRTARRMQAAAEPLQRAGTPVADDDDDPPPGRPGTPGDGGTAGGGPARRR